MMEAKYKIGDEVFVKSRHNGIVKRTIVAVFEPENTQESIRIESSFLVKNHFGYELNKTVQISENYEIGTATVYTDEEEYSIPETDYTPAPEFVLMKMGDLIYDTHPFWRGITNIILTEAEIKYCNPKR